MNSFQNEFKTNIRFSERIYNHAKENKEFLNKDKFKDFINDLKDLNLNIAQKEKNIFRLMTYNVHFFKDILMEDSSHKILQLIELSNPDVLFLQEAIKNHKTIQKLIDLGYEYVFFSPIDDSKNFGNMILSKYPFLENSANEFSNNYKINNEYYRSYIKSEIDLSEVNKKNLIIYCTHLAIYTNVPYYHHSNFSLDEEIREEEIQELLTTISDEDAENNIVIAGDFNSTRKEKALQKLESAKFSTCLSKYPLAFTAWSGTAIDHIYTRFKDIQIDGCYIYYSDASDHLPVILDLKLD